MAFRKAPSKLIKLRVLRFGSDEDGNVRVGVFPEGEKILIGGLGFCGVALQRVGAGEAEMRESADWFADHQTGAIQDSLKLGGCQFALAFS